MMRTGSLTHAGPEVMLEKGSSERSFGMQVIRVQRDGEDYTQLEVAASAGENCYPSKVGT